jgi:hypothetical protein
MRAPLAVVVFACTLLLGPSARGGEPSVPDAAPAVAPARIQALDASIRHLERHLAHLRRARKDLASGRPEPALPADTSRRAIWEVARYESSRAKSVEAAKRAEAQGDEGAASEARSRVDALDAAYLEAIARLEAPESGSSGAKDEPESPGERGR